MSDIVIITPSDAYCGFRLAGITHLHSSSNQIMELLEKLIKSNSFSLIGIDERLLDESCEENLNTIEDNWEGTVVVLPPPADQLPQEDYIARLVRRAIGYHVRLQL